MKAELLNAQTPAQFLSCVLRPLSKEAGKNSLRAVCRRSGIRSPATLSLILAGGRSVSETVAKQLSEGLKLAGMNRRYWLTLAALSRTQATDTKLKLEEELSLIRSTETYEPLTQHQFHFLSEWYYSVIYLICTLTDRLPSPAALVLALGKNVTESQIEKALYALEQLGLIARNEDGTLVAKAAKLKTSEDLRNVTARQWHRRMIGKALTALFLPLEEREITGVILAVDKHRLPELKKLIREFRNFFDEAAQNMTNQPEREIYHLNIQFFPLTRSLEKSLRKG